MFATCVMRSGFLVAVLTRQRTRELGIRLTLGAQPRQILATVIGPSVRWMAWGLAVGLGLSLILTRFLTGLLHGVSPTDPLTFVGVSVLLTAVALLAVYVPARRAVRLGAYSPLRFGFDTTLCMTAMLKGELGQAVTSGRAALTRQPRFSAAMRYLTATYGLQNRPEEARGIYDRLLIEDPDFSDPEIRRKRFRVLHRETEDQILRGLNVCGL